MTPNEELENRNIRKRLLDFAETAKIDLNDSSVDNKKTSDLLKNISRRVDNELQKEFRLECLFLKMVQIGIISFEENTNTAIIIEPQEITNRLLKSSIQSVGKSIKKESEKELKKELILDALDKYLQRQNISVQDEKGKPSLFLKVYKNKKENNDIHHYDEKKETFRTYLKEKKAKRVSPEALMNPSFISGDNIDRYLDKNGILVISTDKGYREISWRDCESLFSSRRLSEFLQKLSEDSTINFYRSDVAYTKDFSPSPCLKNGNSIKTPMYNGKSFGLPKEHTIKNQLISFGEKSVCQRLSEDFILINTPGNPKVMLDISSPPKNTSRTINTKETKKRLSFFSPVDFLPSHKNESHAQYAQRCIDCSDISQFENSYREIFNKTEHDIRKLPLQQQLNFLHFYYYLNQEKKDIIHNAIKRHGNTFVKTFILAENDDEFLHKLTNLAKKDGSEEIFDAYEQYDKNLDIIINKGITGLSENETRNALLLRAKQLFHNIATKLDAEKIEKPIVSDILQELADESIHEKIAQGFLGDVGNALRHKAVDLKNYKNTQASALSTLKNSPELPLKVLAAQGSLKPIPEIHWRVDRDAKEYQRRFGFDVIEFLKNFAPDGGVVVELGSGNGTFKKQVELACPQYQNLSLADKLYYPLNSLIENLLDFNAIESETGLVLNNEERKSIADFCWKTIIINKGELEDQNFTYDEHWQQKLDQNPENIKKALIAKAPLLKTSQRVPDTISTRDKDGSVLYPYKLEKPKSQAFEEALNFIAQNPQNCIKDETAIKNIQAYGEGVMIADFKKIDHLKPQQISALLGVRGLVYLQGDDYIKFCADAVATLDEKGIFVDDSIRDNDGWCYRLAEMKQVQNLIKEECYVICGPGFKGEDFNQTKNVPLAVVISKSSEKLSYIQNSLDKGYEIKPLNEILADDQYLSSLDSTGRVKKNIQLLAS